jgi:AbrB family looped-hinge helix DNA binding protein
MKATATIDTSATAPAVVIDRTHVTVSSKGQVVIPAAIRRELGMEPGTHVFMHIDQGRIVMEADTVESRLRKIDSLRGITAGGSSMTDELIEERRMDLEREMGEGW